MTDLDKLIAEVEAGECPDFCPMWHGKGLCVEAQAAFFGSLDAALRLHEALLPGWRWITRNTDRGDVERGECSEGDAGFANVWEAGNPNYGDPYHYAFSATSARAWLLAILRALKAKGDA